MFHEVVGLVAIIVIPIVLLFALFVYLRRTAPEGTVPAQSPELKPAAPAPVAVVEGPGARVSGARKCTKCGFTTTAAMIGGTTPRCQNCNAALPLA